MCDVLEQLRRHGGLVTAELQLGQGAVGKGFADVIGSHRQDVAGSTKLQSRRWAVPLCRDGRRLRRRGHQGRAKAAALQS